MALGTAVGYNIANVGPAADTLAGVYGVRLGTIGFLTTALFVTHLVMQIPGGRLIDRHGARTLGLAALGVIIVGNTLALVTPVLALGIAGRLVAGLGTGVGFIAGSEYVRATVGSATAQGLYGAAGVGGGGLAIAIVPLVVPPLGWRAPYVTAAAAALLVLASLPLAPRDRSVRRGAAPPVRAASVVRDRGLHPLAVAHTASFGLSVIAGNWAVALLHRDGYGLRLSGAIGAMTLLGGLVTRPLGGRAVQRWHERVAWLLAASMLAAAAGTILLLLDIPLAARIVGSALLGLAAGVPFVAAFAGAQLERPDAPAAAIGFVNSCATLLIVVGTPLLGFTFSLPGHGRVGFAGIAVLLALAGLAIRPSMLPMLRAH